MIDRNSSHGTQALLPLIADQSAAYAKISDSLPPTMSSYTFEDFEEYFYRDVEKGFTADVACCRSCYLDYVAKWPRLANGKDSRFNEGEIDLSHFYEGSYLRDVFTKEEYDQFFPQLKCPRCSSPMNGMLWAFNFDFDVRDGFEDDIEQISQLAAKTPFLLLDHPLCREIQTAVKELASLQAPEPITATFFRARSTSGSTVPRDLKEFDFPPARFVSEGRYNHAGQPVLYLADSSSTCVAELRNAPCLIAELQIVGMYKVLDLTDPFAAHEKHADLLNSLVFSALLSATQEDTGQHRPHYTVSRFVRDCALQAGFDGIKYPSTRLEGFNLVLLQRSPEKTLKLVAYHEHPG